jgi:hypothetical protein
MTSAKTGAEAIPYGARGRPDYNLSIKETLKGFASRA